MEPQIECAIEQVINAMHDKLDEPITIDDMARIAKFSKYHFARIFRDSTGVTPGRFLSALRIQEAKRLLTETSLSIADITSRVGYSSAGTFSARFKFTVGVSPSDYRAGRGHLPHLDTATRRCPGGAAIVRGQIFAAPGCHRNSPAFVGLFPEAIPQGTPVSCAYLASLGPYLLKDVPPGDWHLLICSPTTGEGIAAGVRSPTVGTSGPITIRTGTALVSSVDVRLRPLSPYDPPILLDPPTERLAVAEVEDRAM